MRIWRTLPLVLILISAGSARGQDALQNLEKRVVEFRLPNGMQFLLVREPGAPVFSATISFRVGGVDEIPGITGLAHFYEHLAFKGTQIIGTTNYAEEKALLDAIDEVAVPLSLEMAKDEDEQDKEKIVALRKKLDKLQEQARNFVVKDELWDTYLVNGGSGLNASTGKDLTQYYVSLPNNRLELWAWLESDRMMNPVLREFYSERDVVAEEYRLRIDTSPFGTLYRDFMATAFIAHPARYMTIGWMSDIQTLTRPMAEDFYRTHYAPANAVIGIVGDIDIDKTKAIVTRYFGRIPARDLPPPIRTKEPEQKGERRVKVLWDAQPDLLIGYHKVDPKDKEEPVFDVMHGVLSQGRTSRLYRTLVQEKQLATNVATFSGPTYRYPNLFIVYATPRHPHTAAEVEQAVYEVIQTLVTTPPSGEELEKVRNNLRAQLLQQMQENMGFAQLLSEFHAMMGDWRYLLRNLEQIDKVAPEDVKRVAQACFTEANRTVAAIVPIPAPPAEKAAPEAAALTPAAGDSTGKEK